MLIRMLVAAPATATPAALGTMRFLPPLLGEVPQGRWRWDPVQRARRDSEHYCCEDQCGKSPATPVARLEHGLSYSAGSKATTASGGWAGAVVAASYSSSLFLLLGLDLELREVRGRPFCEEPAAGATDQRGAFDNRDGGRIRAGGGCPLARPVHRRVSPVPTGLLGWVPERAA